MSSTLSRTRATFATDAAIAAGAPAAVRLPRRRLRRPPSDLDRWSRRRTLAFIVGTNLVAWMAIVEVVRLALRASV
jgi:hypothetical protein